MDNAIRFDHSSMLKNDNRAWSLNQESVDLNAYLAHEYLLLKELSIIANCEFNEPDRTATTADYFFDREKEFFYDKRLSSHSSVQVEGCEAYIPLWAGIATPAQTECVLKYLTDPLKFATYIPFPTVTADHPNFSPNGYWRGPIWLDQVYFAIHGLRNYGYTELADGYTKQVFDRLNGLRTDAPIHENYETSTGKRLKSPHFSWSAAHLLLLYRESGVLDGKQTDFHSKD
jgi:putative isomerase